MEKDHFRQPGKEVRTFILLEKKLGKKKSIKGSTSLSGHSSAIEGLEESHSTGRKRFFFHSTLRTPPLPPLPAPHKTLMAEAERFWPLLDYA